MAESKSITERFGEFVAWAEDTSDPRTKGWLLIASPSITYSLVFLYLLIVWQGQRFMAKREALQLKGLMMVYNFVMVIFNAYLFFEIVAVTVFNPGFNLVCQGVDYSEDENAVRLASVLWWYFFSKIIEFADTFIFILRKKNSQISFLHVYHHATMPMLWYIGVRWVGGGAAYYSAAVNSFIHILMYSYYFLSAMGPSIQPYLWWKRYLTTLQLMQFLSILAQGIASLLTECSYPYQYVYANLLYITSHVLLFSNFYHKSYVRSPKGAAGKKSHQNGAAAPQTETTENGRYNLRERNANGSKHD